MSERPFTAPQLSKAYGFTPRYWIRLAAAGKIPGARQPSGPGGHGCFEVEPLRQWMGTSHPKQSLKDFIKRKTKEITDRANPKPPPPDPNQNYIYFVKLGDRVKIGISKTPTARIKSIQHATGRRVQTLAIRPGTLTEERELHRRFRKCRAIGEWFKIDGNLKTFLETL